MANPSLIGHWPLDESSGSVAHDLASGNTGQVSGAAVWQPSAGRVNGACQFDGLNDYIDLPTILIPPSAPSVPSSGHGEPDPAVFILTQTNGTAPPAAAGSPPTPQATSPPASMTAPPLRPLGGRLPRLRWQLAPCRRRVGWCPSPSLCRRCRSRRRCRPSGQTPLRRWPDEHRSQAKRPPRHPNSGLAPIDNLKIWNRPPARRNPDPRSRFRPDTDRLS